MSNSPDHAEAPQACQAIPGVARRGWRTDPLCASNASTDVAFSGRLVAVCRMHQATYVRWGAEAEQKATELWGWHPGPVAGR